MMRRPRLYLRFQFSTEARSGGGGANARAAEVLTRQFDIVQTPESADLQVCSFGWNAPATPPRLFLDHGSFADASFWAYTVPKLRRGDTILVTSEVCEKVAERFLVPGCVRILRVPLPVDLEAFQPAPDRVAARLDLERSHSIPANGPLLLVVAAFVRRKNHHLAIDLLRAMLRRRSDCLLAIAGSTPDTPSSRAYHENVAALAAEPGLDGRVRFLGPQPVNRVAALMRGADLLVHLSTCRLENFGLVVAEAAASGLPVLAADWGGLRDVVVDGQTGWLAPTWLSDRGPRTDWSTLIDPAVQLLDDADAWHRMSVAGRRRAEAEFSQDVHARRLCSAVDAATAGSISGDQPVTLTESGNDLLFRTLTLNALHREIRDTGDEFRLLIPIEGGRYYRLLTGPAATFERAPRLQVENRPYALVRWRSSTVGVEILDPAWPASVSLDEASGELLRRCDGATAITSMGGRKSETLERLQRLADEGVIGTWAASDGRP